MRDHFAIGETITTSDNYLFSKLFNNTNKSIKSNNSIAELCNIKMKKLLFSTNDPNTKLSINLQLIFNVFKTNSEFPFIKIIEDNNNINYKIFKPFIKQYGKRFLKNWKVSDNIKAPYLTRPNIVFKIQINENNYMDVTLYDNYYMIIKNFQKSFIIGKMILKNIRCI